MTQCPGLKVADVLIQSLKLKCCSSNSPKYFYVLAYCSAVLPKLNVNSDCFFFMAFLKCTICIFQHFTSIYDIIVV